ncbi:hypothetical protein OAP36_02075 [Planktomarina temperata]|nr:hypothetical protein [Planktomarina temperata]
MTTLVLSNRSLSGAIDGPQEVLEQFLSDKIFDYVNLFSLNGSLRRQYFYSILVVLKIIFDRRVKILSYKHFVFFPYQSTPVCLLLLLKLFGRKISVVGYDSFFRNYKLLQSRRLGFKNRIKNRLLILHYYIIESTISKIADEIYLVSRECISHSNYYFTAGNYVLFHLNPIDELPKSEAIGVIETAADIFGPFISDYDVYDLQCTIEKVKNLGLEPHQIALFGEGASSVMPELPFHSRIEWVEEFEGFHGARRHLAIINRGPCAGVSTRAQKLIRLGRCVYVKKGVDVGSAYKTFVKVFP